MSGIEVALLGTAASAGAASTAGLIGAGGALSLGAGTLFSASSLATGLSLASVASSVMGGMQQSSALRQQGAQEAWALNMTARQDSLDAQREELRGKTEVNDMMDGLIQTIASQQAAFAANGIDTGFGTPQSVHTATRNIAERQMGVTREDARIRAISRRASSYARREQAINAKTSSSRAANSAMIEGFTKAGGSIAEMVDRKVSRG